MKNPRLLLTRREAAFTLIELIVVIAIIAILASLLIPVVGKIAQRKKIAVAQAQLQVVEAAIDGYKTKLGYYPPDNTNEPAINPLFFELMGTTNNGVGGAAPNLWVTMDGSARIGGSGAPPNIASVFSLSGFANTSTRAHSDDQGQAATTFINNLTPNEVGLYNLSDPNIKILVCSVAWPPDKIPAVVPGNPSLNPWRYVSTHPTNNTASYDLWVDLVFGNKTNRICNWSPNPIPL